MVPHPPTPTPLPSSSPFSQLVERKCVDEVDACASTRTRTHEDMSVDMRKDARTGTCIDARARVSHAHACTNVARAEVEHHAKEDRDRQRLPITNIVMAYIVMAYIVMASIVMAYIAMAYIVMASTVMAYSYGLCSYGLCSYGLHSYGLYLWPI